MSAGAFSPGRSSFSTRLNGTQGQNDLVSLNAAVRSQLATGLSGRNRAASLGGHSTERWNSPNTPSPPGYVSSTSQSLLGATSAGPALFDASLERALQQLEQAASIESRHEAAQRLRLLYERKFQTLKQPEAMSSLSEALAHRLQRLINSSSQRERMAGLAGLDALIDTRGEPYRGKVQRTYNGLRPILRRPPDWDAARAVAGMLGRLSRLGGVLVNRFVEAEAIRALEYLNTNSVLLKGIAVMVLNALCVDVPASMYTSRIQLAQIIWKGLTDSRPAIRLESASLLRSILALLEQRASDDSARTCQLIVDRCLELLITNERESTPAEIHGALLALHELVRNPFSASFLDQHFERLRKRLESLRLTRDNLTRVAVLQLLPDMVRRDNGLLELGMSMALENEDVVALGKLAVAVGPTLALPWMEHIFAVLRSEQVAPTAKHECLALIAPLVLDTDTSLRLAELLDENIFPLGLSAPLVEALESIIAHVPSLRDVLQARILRLCAESRDTACALRALQRFAFEKRPCLDDYVRLHVLPHLYGKNSFRPPAFAASLHLLACAIRAMTPGQPLQPKLFETLQQLIVVVVADPDSRVRAEALQCLSKSDYFQILERYLAQPELLRALCLALHDEDITVRERALSLVGRLSGVNPAHTLPSLRRLFLSLRMILECERETLQGLQEDALRLLLRLIQDAPHLIEPYIPATAMLLVNRLQKNSSSVVTADTSTVHTLHSIACLAERGLGAELQTLLHDAMPHLLQILQHTSVETELREAACRALSSLARATGATTELYTQYPSLLPILLRILRTESSLHVRLEIERTIGTLGAVDPERSAPLLLDRTRYPYVPLDTTQAPLTVQAVAPDKTAAATKPAITNTNNNNNNNSERGITLRDSSVWTRSTTGPLQGSRLAFEAPNENETLVGRLPHPFTANEEYFPSAALDALNKILADTKLAALHYDTVGAIVNIMTSLGMKNAPFLSAVVPRFLWMLRPQTEETHDLPFREYVIRGLASVVLFARQYIRPYAESLVALILEYWPVQALHRSMFALMECLCAALSDEFRPYVPILLPLVLPSMSLRVIKVLLVFGAQVGDYAPLILPPLMRFLEDSNRPLAARTEVLKRLPRLWASLDLTDMASLLLHPLCRMLRSAELQWQARHLLESLLPRLGLDAAYYTHLIQEMLTRGVSLTNAQATLQAGAGCPGASDSGQVTGVPTEPDHLPSGVSNNSTAAGGASSASALHRLALHRQERQAMNRSDSLDSLNGLTLTASSGSLGDLVSSDGVLGQSPDSLLDGSHVSLVASASMLDLQQQALGGSGTGSGDGRRHHVNEKMLQKAWQVGRRATREDWNDWMMGLASALFRESGSPSLRSCARLAEVHSPLARELFNAAFLSCWTELRDSCQSSLVKNLVVALSSDSIPLDVLQVLLSLVEFMEHDEKPLPIDLRQLAAMAFRCGAYAKALRYKEAEYLQNPVAAMEGNDSLIAIYEALGQREAAMGALLDAEHRQVVIRHEECYEKLQQWDLALIAYERQPPPHSFANRRGKVRCLAQLGELHRMEELCSELWAESVDSLAQRQELAEEAAEVAFRLQLWNQFRERVAYTNTNSIMGNLYRAMLAIHQGDYEAARQHIRTGRRLLDTGVTARVSEGYPRAYGDILHTQQLVELEECVMVLQRQLPQRHVEQLWNARLDGARLDYATWHQTLLVRSLLLEPKQDKPTWLRFVSLCRRANRLPMATEVLQMLQDDSDDPQVEYAAIKLLWSKGKHEEAYEALRQCVQRPAEPRLAARRFLKLSHWGRALRTEGTKAAVRWHIFMEHARRAAVTDPSWSPGWHTWAALNADAAAAYSTGGRFGGAWPARPAAVAAAESNVLVRAYVLNAVNAFFRAIALGESHAEQEQDALKLLTLWFRYGAVPEIEQALLNGFAQTNVDTWVDVIPQIVARLHSPVPPVQAGVRALLIRIGRAHPQALVFPLAVAAKSSNPRRREAAMDVLQALRLESPTLVSQAELVSRELVRIAVLWPEMWHEALEEASRVYFGDHDVQGMLAILSPLHDMVEAGPVTARETAFVREFGRELAEAREWCRRYLASSRESDLNQAWELYYSIFRRINKSLSSMTQLQLAEVSPALLDARNLELAVPGTGERVTIASFAPVLNVISSKQRPRTLTIYGSDGHEYPFLLKGHEDLRQDERVQQFFGLVNTLLPPEMSIITYAVLPLSQSVGLIGWVKNCDTLHALIREYREQRKIILNVEHRIMLSTAPDYDNLTLLQKVEIFEYVLANTSGNDLANIMWLRSRSAEMWLERRTNYARSLAVMSMVGYVIGLGDRHPSNILITRDTGKVIHIDHGDCFETAMHRDKYPEKVPFRLTRMLVRALGVSGVEGIFRATCESTMQILRANKSVLMAMLEIFVHDPLLVRTLQPQANQMNGTKTTTALMTSTGTVAVHLGTPLHTPTLWPNEAATRRELAAVGAASMQPETRMDDAGAGVEQEVVAKRPPAATHPTEVALMNRMAPIQRPEASASSFAPETGVSLSLRLLQGTMSLRAALRLEQQNAGTTGALIEEGAAETPSPVQGRRGANTSRTLVAGTAAGQLVPAQLLPEEMLGDENRGERAVAIVQRMSQKLSGRDFDPQQVLTVAEQVERLIQQATSSENLAPAYVGWCNCW
jgi:FKBP12-rapamycin complex-associated protein